MTTTATAKERTIITTKVTASGVKSVLAMTSVKQLGRARDLCDLLTNVPHLKDQAERTSIELSTLINLSAE